MVDDFLVQTEFLLMWLAPVAVAFLALRRLLLSQSFNRVLYGLVLLHCALVIDMLLAAADDHSLFGIFAHAMAYSPPLLWATIFCLADSTRGAAPATPYSEAHRSATLLQPGTLPR